MYMIQENVVGVPFFVFWCPLVYDGMMLVGSLKPNSREGSRNEDEHKFGIFRVYQKQDVRLTVDSLR